MSPTQRYTNLQSEDTEDLQALIEQTGRKAPERHHCCSSRVCIGCCWVGICFAWLLLGLVTFELLRAGTLKPPGFLNGFLETLQGNDTPSNSTSNEPVHDEASAEGPEAEGSAHTTSSESAPVPSPKPSSSRGKLSSAAPFGNKPKPPAKPKPSTVTASRADAPAAKGLSTSTTQYHTTLAPIPTLALPDSVTTFAAALGLPVTPTTTEAGFSVGVNFGHWSMGENAHVTHKFRQYNWVADTVQAMARTTPTPGQAPAQTDAPQPPHHAQVSTTSVTTTPPAPAPKPGTQASAGADEGTAAEQHQQPEPRAASGHCMGEADQKLWQGGANESFDTDMTGCATGCLGASGCVSHCMRRKVGYTNSCSDCIGGLSSCSAAKCWWQCMGGRSAGCTACAKQQCTPHFQHCSGLELD